MITVRKAEERGHANHGWLDSWHTFSFASYFDPRHMKFRSLRVINEDRIKGGKGFANHPHRNMEIVTYVVEGELEHKDSMGNGSTIRPGELQRMTAGTGIEHSEFNPGQGETHLLQIWIMPEKAGLEPGYEQRAFPTLGTPGQLVLLASRTGRDGSLTIHQDADLYGCRLEQEHSIPYSVAKERHVWIQVVKGTIVVNGSRLDAGDGTAIEKESRLDIVAESDAELLLFDLA